MIIPIEAMKTENKYCVMCDDERKDVWTVNVPMADFSGNVCMRHLNNVLNSAIKNNGHAKPGQTANPAAKP